MSFISSLVDAVKRVAIGHNMSDNIDDWLAAHRKAKQSRQELDKTVKEAELLEQAKKHQSPEDPDKK